MNTPEFKNGQSAHHTAATSVSAAAAQAGARLRHAALLVISLLTLGTVAGLWPRWRQGDVLRAETRDQALPTVAVISPAPAEAGPGSASYR